jgi:hypothetical protein
MSAGVGEEVSLALEPQAEGRGDYRMSHYWKMVKSIVETQRKPYHRERGTDLNPIFRIVKMPGCKCTVNRRIRQCSTFDLDHGDIDLAGAVDSLAPRALAVALERHRKPNRLGHVLGVDVQLNVDAIREVITRLVNQHVSACHQEQSFVALEEKPTRVGQEARFFKGEDGRRGKQKRFDPRHRSHPSRYSDQKTPPRLKIAYPQVSHRVC